MELRLDDAQVELLRELLDRAFRDIRYEISNTDTSTFKRELQERRDRIEALLDQVGGALPDRV